MRTFQYFVDNAWHDPASGSYIDSENPATGEAWARVPDCNVVRVAVRYPRPGFAGGGIFTVDVAVRRGIVPGVIDKVLEGSHLD